MSVINQTCVGMKGETLLGEYILTGWQNSFSVSIRSSCYRDKCLFCVRLFTRHYLGDLEEFCLYKGRTMGSMASKIDWGDKSGKLLSAMGKWKWECQWLSGSESKVIDYSTQALQIIWFSSLVKWSKKNLTEILKLQVTSYVAFYLNLPEVSYRIET